MVFSSFLCVLRVKSFPKTVNTEDTEKRGENRRIVESIYGLKKV